MKWTRCSMAFAMALMLAGNCATTRAATLFEDTYNRDDSRNIDASLAGITDNTGSSLAADAVYTQPFLDPGNDPGPQDGDAANGGGAQVIGNALQLAVGAGTSNAYLNHNFTNGQILADGGLIVTMNVLETEGAAGNGGQGGAFALGMSAAEAASTGDAFNGHASGSPDPGFKYTGAFGPDGTVVSDFWIALKADNNLQWGSTGDSGIVSVGADGGEVAVRFDIGDFNAGTTVPFEVYYNGASQGSGAFTWSGTDENYIALDARDNGFVAFDSFAVQTIPEPGSMLLATFAAGLLAASWRRGC